MANTRSEKRIVAIPICDAFLDGFKLESSIVRDFWIPGGMIHRRSEYSDMYLITRHPERPRSVARLVAAGGRSTRVELRSGIRNLRSIFRRACSDSQLAALRFSTSESNVVLSLGTTSEALEAGRVLGTLHKSKKIER